MNVQLKVILTAFLLLTLGGVMYSLEFKKSGEDQMIFCDVGQGDGYMIISGNVQVVVDAGLGLKMVECMSRYLPVWDRDLEAMILTHPQRDHMEGQVEILKRFNVKKVIWPGALGEGALFDEWQDLAELEGAQIVEPARGDAITAGAYNFEVLWPTKSFMNLWKQVPGDDLNETSLVLRANYGNLCAYLTGDITVERLVKLVDKKCELLKVSHHGSKTGTSAELVQVLEPKLAVIQVGKSNNYGHPTEEVLDFLNSAGVQLLRNDRQGDIKLRFDQDNIYVKD